MMRQRELEAAISKAVAFRSERRETLRKKLQLQQERCKESLNCRRSRRRPATAMEFVLELVDLVPQCVAVAMQRQAASRNDFDERRFNCFRCRCRPLRVFG